MYCAGTTKTGQPCRKLVKAPERFCYLHKPSASLPAAVKTPPPKLPRSPVFRPVTKEDLARLPPVPLEAAPKAAIAKMPKVPTYRLK